VTTPAPTHAASRHAAQPRHRRRIDRTWHWHVVLAPLAVLWSLPLVMVIGLSLLPTSNPQTTAFGLLPAEPSLRNYVTIWEDNPILQHLVNSLLITVPSVALVVLLGSMAAFALARLRVPLKAVIFGVLILALILPMSSIVVAVFKILQALGLYDSRLGLVLVYAALGLPFAVIVIRTSFLAVPQEIYEAARIDGAGRFQIYWRIYLPMARPAIAVVVIWHTMMTWNDFLLPLVSLGDNDLKPLTLVPLAYRGTFLSQPGALFAILVLISLPIVAVFVLLQRHLVNGLSGAIK